MACALYAGYTIDCRDAVGGLDAVYFIDFAGVSSMTDASGVITAMHSARPMKYL